MSKYIDANKFMIEARKNHSIVLGRGDRFTLAEILEEIPAADVAPVVHSKWVISSDGYYPYCLNCTNEPPGRVMTDYCPKCGAKMDAR